MVSCAKNGWTNPNDLHAVDYDMFLHKELPTSGSIIAPALRSLVALIFSIAINSLMHQRVPIRFDSPSFVMIPSHDGKTDTCICAAWYEQSEFVVCELTHTHTEAGSRRLGRTRGCWPDRGRWHRRASAAAPSTPAASAGDVGCRRGTRRRRAGTRRWRAEAWGETTARWRRRAPCRWPRWGAFASCCRRASAAARPLTTTVWWPLHGPICSDGEYLKIHVF